MRQTLTLIAAAIVAALALAGAAEARSVAIGGFTGQTFGPDDSSPRDIRITTGLKYAGPGRYTVRDAKTGKLVDKGKTGTKSGTYKGPNGEDVNVGTADLMPGTYRIEIWQTDGRGNSFKGERTITITKRFGTGAVIEELEPQKPSEVAMDEAIAIRDKLETLKYIHDHALDAAGTSETQQEFDNATGFAREIWEEMNELKDKYIDKRIEAARLAGEEKKAEEKKKKAEEEKKAENKKDKPEKVSQGNAAALSGLAAATAGQRAALLANAGQAGQAHRVQVPTVVPPVVPPVVSVPREVPRLAIIPQVRPNVEVPRVANIPQVRPKVEVPRVPQPAAALVRVAPPKLVITVRPRG